MKPMFKPKDFVVTPRVQKWGLFFVLAGTLGFNLSMNPEVAYHMARNEKSHSLDLAQTATPEAVKIDGKRQELSIGGKKGLFKATIVSVDSVTVARFERIGDTEGKVCELCGKSFVLNSSFDKLSDLNTELVSIVNGENKQGGDSTTPVVAQKSGEATEVDLEEWAKKCDKASEDSQLSCHKQKLVELSKYLKNTSDNDHFVMDYFKDHLLQELKSALYLPTVNTRTLESDSERFEDAQEMVNDLMGQLRGLNGKSTLKTLIKLQAGSFSSQFKNSQALAKQGLSEGNTLKYQIGLRGMDLTLQRTLLENDNQTILDTIQDNSNLSSSQKAQFSNDVGANFYSPVANMLDGAKNFFINGDPNNKAAPHNLTDYQVIAVGLDGNTYLVDASQVVPGQTQILTRQAGIVRGGGLIVPTQQFQAAPVGFYTYNPMNPLGTTTTQQGPFQTQLPPAARTGTVAPGIPSVY